MKRILILALCLMLLCPAALAEVFIVYCYGSEESDSFALLLTDDGTALTPEDTYADIQSITPADTPEAERLYTATPAYLPGDTPVDENDYRSYTMYALLDARGKPLTGFDYYSVRYDPSGMIIARRYQGPTDVLSPEGDVLRSFNYADACPTGEGWLALRLEGKKPTEYGYDEERFSVVFVDDAGHVFDTGLHTTSGDLMTCVDGMCPLLYVEEYDGDALLLGAEGEPIMGRAFDYIEDVYNGRAIVTDGDGASLIDADGRALLSDYSYINRSGDDANSVYIAHRDSTLDIYDVQTLKLIASRTFNSQYVFGYLCAEGLLELSGGTVTELVDMEGNTLLTLDDKDGSVSPSYAIARGRPERLVLNTGSWPRADIHLVDLHGNVVNERSFQTMNAVLWENGQGRYVTGTFDLTTSDSGDEYTVWNSYRYGVCDENGNQILENRYLDADVLSLDRYWVRTADRSGMIDGEGNWYYTIYAYESLMD